MLLTHTFLYHAEHWFLLFKKNWHWNKVTSVFVFIPPPPTAMFDVAVFTLHFCGTTSPSHHIFTRCCEEENIVFHSWSHVRLKEEIRSHFNRCFCLRRLHNGLCFTRVIRNSKCIFTQRFQFYVRNYSDCVVGHGCYKTWVTYTQCCAWMHPL